MPQERVTFNLTINGGLAAFVSTKTHQTFFTCNVNPDDPEDQQHAKAEQAFDAHLKTLHLRSENRKHQATFESLYEKIVGVDPLVQKQKDLEKRSRENFLHQRSWYRSANQKSR